MFYNTDRICTVYVVIYDGGGIMATVLYLLDLHTSTYVISAYHNSSCEFVLRSTWNNFM